MYVASGRIYKSKSFFYGQSATGQIGSGRVGSGRVGSGLVNRTTGYANAQCIKHSIKYTVQKQSIFSPLSTLSL